MTSSSIMYDNNESYIAVEQPKNLIVWRNILKKAQKKRSHRQNQYTPNSIPWIYKKNWVEKWEECHHTLPKIGGDTMQE